MTTSRDLRETSASQGQNLLTQLIVQTTSSGEEEGPEGPPEASSNASSRSGSPDPTAEGIDDAEQEEPEGDELAIVSFNGHRWVKGNVELQVIWTDEDVTWEPLANVNDCAAMDDYLAYRSVADPLQLGKRRALIDKSYKASN
ncbi:hypothetical protein C8F01DRAFT_1153137 [Mycena amicta]|nr:hypothetical protein C8F01DRAFT_1153137 [Mycena amicta]